MTEFAELLPPLSTEEFEALRADIREHGVLNPVYVDEAGNVLDGRHRLKIDKNAPRKVIKGLTDAEKQAFVFRSNFVRRNLSPDQKAEARRKMKEVAKRLREEDARKWTNAKVGRALGLSTDAVEVWFRKPDPTTNPNHRNGSNCRPDARVKIAPAAKPVIAERVAAGESQAQVAADLGVSQQQVSNIVNAERKRTDQAAKRTEKPPLPAGVFDMLYVDPPWQYDFAPTDSRKIENQYPTLTVEQLAALKVPAADDCVLYLWATAPKLREALRVMEAWEFEYKSHAVWDKEKIGMGYWFRGQHELLLVGTRGKFSPPEENLRPSSVIRGARGKHSEKPTLVYELLERMFPHASKVELFARSQRPGWEAWGNET